VLVRTAVRGWQRSGGWFDPTIHDALHVAGHDRTFELLNRHGTTDATVACTTTPQATSPAPGCEGILIDDDAGTVGLLAGVRFDPGGISNGQAADLLVDELLAAGAYGACVNLGGDMRVAGDPPTGPAGASPYPPPSAPPGRSTCRPALWPLRAPAGDAGATPTAPKTLSTGWLSRPDRRRRPRPQLRGAPHLPRRREGSRVNLQVAWYVAHAAGLVAWALAAAALLAGFALSGRAFDRRRVPAAWFADLHRFLGALAVVFTGVHIAALLADDYVAFTVTDVLVPFASAWRPGAVAWGVVALYLLLAVELSSLLRPRLPAIWWRRVHLLTIPLYGVGSLHLLTAGSDAAPPLLRLTVLTVTATFLVLAVFRILHRPPRTTKQRQGHGRGARAAIR
jgi:DMSO/TMAO reductase YedYZ heme-binding membrane subunit